MAYFGSKATSGLCQPLIAMMPPHDTYIETHLGGGAIMRRKPAALHTDAACTGRERRTLIDIVFEKVVRHADAQIKHCPRCHAETRARFPLEMPGPLQYGPGIKAYVVHLLIAQMLSLKRVAQSMHALIGRTLSEATLLGYLAQLHHALAEWERRAIEHLLVSPAMHIDETLVARGPEKSLDSR